MHTIRRRPFAKSACFVALLATGVLLTGCSTEHTSAEFCSDYANAWNSFAATRALTDVERGTVLAARDRLLEDWDRLNMRDDAPGDVTAMVPIVSASFTQAWNASSPSEQRAYQLSWRNSQDYIAMQCGSAGHLITFDGAAVTLAPPAQNDPAD